MKRTGFEFLHALHIRRLGGLMEEAVKTDWYVIGRLDDGTHFRLEYVAGATSWTCDRNLGASLRRRILDRLRNELRYAATLPEYCQSHDVVDLPKEVHTDIVYAFTETLWRSFLPEAPTMIDLDVPFSEKDHAKSLGARWNSTRRIWQAPANAAPETFERWLPVNDRPGTVEADPEAEIMVAIIEAVERTGRITGAVPPAAFRRRSDAAAVIERMSLWIDLDRTTGRAVVTPEGQAAKEDLRLHRKRLRDLLGAPALEPMHGTWLSWYATSGSYAASDLILTQTYPEGFDLYPYGHHALVGGMSHGKLTAPVDALYDGRERIALLLDTPKSVVIAGLYRSISDRGNEITLQAGFERYHNAGIDYPIDTGHHALVPPALALLDGDIRRIKSLRPDVEITVDIVPLEGKIPRLMRTMLIEKLERLGHQVVEHDSLQASPTP